jgi:hypothetical protein
MLAMSRGFPTRPADALRHHGTRSRESRLGAGIGGAGGDDAELHRRERPYRPRPKGVSETLQRLGGAVRGSEGTVRRGDGCHRRAVSQERETCGVHQDAPSADEASGGV